MTIRIMIYYIFRHGETFVSKNDLQYGDTYKSAEILPEAIPVIEKIGNYLKSKIGDNNFTSLFRRAIQTTDIVTKITGKVFIPDERLREEDISRAEESLEQLESRLKSFLDEIKIQDLQCVSICSHEWPIVSLIALITRGYVTRNTLSEKFKCGQLLIIDGTSLKTLDFN